MYHESERVMFSETAIKKLEEIKTRYPDGKVGS